MPSLPLSRSRALVLAVGLLALLAVAGRMLSGAGASSPGPADALVAAPSTTTAASKLVVHVTGAVSQPGLYRLEEGSRVADAVARAGGATASADSAAVNLAAPLADGMQVLIPSRVAGAAGAAAPAPGRVSLNAASVAELDELPGIGPVTAQKIVDYRTAHGGFESVDDLDAIPGIGAVRIDQLRDLVGP